MQELDDDNLNVKDFGEWIWMCKYLNKQTKSK